MTTRRFLPRRLHLICATAVAAAIALLAPQSASATTQDDLRAEVATAPPVEDITVTVQGEEQTISLNLPWRLVEDEIGEVQMFVGPGVLDTQYEGEVVAAWDGPATSQRSAVAAAAAQANWSCSPTSQDPRRSGGQIQGYVGASCTGVMPSYRLQWQFERHAAAWESVTGWKQYSSRKTTSWTSASATGTYVYAHCNSSDGRSQTYTTYHRGETTGGYVWSWHRSQTSASWFNCGYSEY